MKSLNDSQIVSGRRAAIKSFAAKAGLAAAVLVTGAVLAAQPAAASDRHSQTDHDDADRVNQTDND